MKYFTPGFNLDEQKDMLKKIKGDYFYDVSIGWLYYSFNITSISNFNFGK